MNDHELAKQQPSNIDDALDCMRATLKEFHGEGDKRAIFLRLYYIMTLEVHAAINGIGDYQGQNVFLDAQWVRALSGKFATLYFKALDTRGREPDERVERAWKAADRRARSNGSTVVQNALLGINAHINYDLPRAIAANLDPARAHGLPGAAAAQVRPRPGEQPAGPDAGPDPGGPRPGLRTRHRARRQRPGQARRAHERDGAQVLPGAGLVGRVDLRLGPYRSATRPLSATS